MKIIYDNIIFSLQKAGGISMYWAELVKRISNKEVKFFEESNANIFRKEIDIFVNKESSLPIPLRIKRYLPFLHSISEKSIFHSSYYRVSLSAKAINITTVHDFTYEYFSSGIVQKVHSLQKSFAINKADAIICVSHNTKKDLIKFYPHLDEKRIRVIYNGVSDSFYPIKKLTDLEIHYIKNTFYMLQDKTYLLYVGDRSDYKNFYIAVESCKKMNDLYLVVVGGQPFSEIENKLIQDIKSKIVHFQGISSKELNILYNRAHCLIYPSSYEGFGIPLVEAMKAGCPVVAYNSSAVPEVVGNAGFLVNTLDIDEFIKKIKLLKNENIRYNLIEKGFKQATLFNWDICFKQTYHLYQEVFYTDTK